MSVAAFADADLSGRTAYQIGSAFASKPIGRVIGTNAVNRLHGIAVLFGKTFVQTLVGGVDGIIVIAAACISRIIKTDIGVAVADAEKADAGDFIGFVGLFKLKGGLRFGCVCQCVCR